MKKVFVILIALAATMVACNKVADVNEPQESVKEIVFNMEVKQADAQDTKAVKTGWENGDKVYVFFKGLVGADKYAIFSYDGSAWTKDANAITAGDLESVAGDKQLTAVYFPFGTPIFTANGDKFDVTAEQSYYLSVNTTYTSAVVDASLVLTAELNMTIPNGFVQFSMPSTDGTNTFFRETPVYTLTEDSEPQSFLAPADVTAITPGSAPTQTVGSYGAPLKGYFYGEGNARCILFSGILYGDARGNSTTYNFTFVNKNDNAKDYDDVTYKYSVTAKLYQGTSSWRAVKFPLISSSRWTVPVPDYVTVGGIKWAKWNVGATTETGYGDYFAWGAIYPQYRYSPGDYHESLGDNSIDDAHDVAYQKLGSVWHMPTTDQLSALSSKILSSSTWQEDLGTGVNGYLIAPDTGHESEGSLFLPTAGYWENTLGSAGYFGYDWSSTYVSTYDAGYLRFDHEYYGPFVGSRSSYSGCSVRPVHN